MTRDAEEAAVERTHHASCKQGEGDALVANSWD